MTSADRLVVFSLDDRRFALRLHTVERVIRAVAIQLLPKAPRIVLGVVNLGGRVIPVVDPRGRFGAAARELAETDHLIIARASGREVALLVDAVHGILEGAGVATTPAPEILPGLAYVEGVVKLSDGLIFIHDLDTFLSLDEAAALDRALAETPV